jgi:hypothetical protein
MVIEIDDLDFSAFSPAQIASVRPMMEELAVKTRRNLRLLDSILGIEAERPDLAHEHDRLCIELHEATMLAAALEDDLALAHRRIKALEDRIAALEDTEIEATIYRSVGLASTAHAVVVSAARRALLHHHHPDRAPPAQRAAATRQFQAVSAAFDRIVELRR